MSAITQRQAWSRADDAAGEGPSRAGRSTVPDVPVVSANGPAVAINATWSSAERVLGLQRAIGNRAVTAALRKLVAQRQPVPPSRDGQPSMDDDLERVLEDIRASMKFPERVAPMEVISATTAAEFSSGELDLAVEKFWKRERLDFTTAARKAVATPARGGAATGTKSPRLDPSRRYALRRAVSLLASDYKTGADLDEVAAMARRGSPYRSALTKEFGEPTIVSNPTGAKMRSSIFDAILKMWIDLDEGEVGELVVTFSGHGGGGFFSGVDWDEVSGDELTSLASLAADHNVHLVFVMDTCRAGLFVGAAQGASTRDLRSRIGELPADRRKPFLARLEFLRDVTKSAFDLGVASHKVGSAARNEVKKRTDANRLAYFESLVELSKQNSAFGRLLGGSRPPGTPDLKAVGDGQERLGWSTVTAMAGSGAEVPSTLHAAARVLDVANDVINQGLEQLDAEVRAARPRAAGRVPSGDRGQSAQR